jgi:hypothetical protein
VQEDRGVVLVRRDGIAKREAAEILEQVVQLVEARVIGMPERIAPREVLGRERGEAQQVVASVHHHVDREVVAGEHEEIGAPRVA